MSRGRLTLTAGLAVVCVGAVVAQACTDGTTPDCSHGQCLVVSVVEAGGEGAAADGQGDAGDADETDAGALGAKGDAEAGPARDAGSSAGDGGDSG